MTKDEPVTADDILEIHRLFYGQIDKDNAGMLASLVATLPSDRITRLCGNLENGN